MMQKVITDVQVGEKIKVDGWQGYVTELRPNLYGRIYVTLSLPGGVKYGTPVNPNKVVEVIKPLYTLRKR